MFENASTLKNYLSVTYDAFCHDVLHPRPTLF
ncbi:unnamed protein product [Sphacelaria rigidula]